MLIYRCAIYRVAMYEPNLTMILAKVKIIETIQGKKRTT